jgi:prepilin-type processing-associated H-X9-DG protein
VQCLSQLRQIGQGFFAYAVSYGGKLPMWSGRHEYPDDRPVPGDINWAVAPAWPVQIERFVGQKPDGAIWNCPAWPDEQRRVNYFLGARWMHEQNPILRTIPLSRIRQSSSYILSGDCTSQEYYPPPYGIDMTGPFEDIDKDDGAIKCLRFRGESGGFNMHRIGNNVLFADGHAATFQKFDPAYLTYSPLTAGVEWEDAGPEGGGTTTQP